MDWPRTLVARGTHPVLLAQHLRYRAPAVRQAVLHCVMLDTSASMLRGGRLLQGKAWLHHIAIHSYQRRAHLAVLTFGGTQAHWLHLPHKAQPLHGPGWTAPIGAGGGTPLHAALHLLHRLPQQFAQWAPQPGRLHLHLWLISDGRFARPWPARPPLAAHCTLIDLDNSPVRLHLARELAQHWRAQWVDGWSSAPPH